MPDWRKVPELKTIALRKLAWPDAVNKAHSQKQFPSLESYLRNTLIAKYFYGEKKKYKTRKKHNIATPKEPTREITEDVINAWIRLSNYYETKLGEIDSMAMFMHMSTIGKLDFLHEGFTLRDEKDYLHKIQPYIGVVPHTLRPQKIDYRTWFDLVNVLVQEGVVETLEHLFIPFGNDDIKIWNDTLPGAGLTSPSLYRFEETLENFVHLKTLVVRGPMVQDNFMLAVGENCYFLEHLDVRGTKVTDRGVALLLFKKLGRRFFRGTFIGSQSRFPPFPFEILRPCCSTLKYLDISEIRVSQIPGFHAYDLYITKACPQLRATPLRFYYGVPGKTRVVLTDFIDGSGLRNFRQELVCFVRQSHTERLFDFVQVLLGCIHFEDPRLEIMENEHGEEISYLFESGSAIILHCELENLIIVTFVSYVRSTMNFIPISLIAKFAPRVRKIKASLCGALHEAIELTSLKMITAAAVKNLQTLASIIEHCPNLQYLEVRDVLMMDTTRQFGNAAIEAIFPKDPGEYKSLEVLRLLFQNQIMLHSGISWIAGRCPALRIIGDLSVWGIPFDTVMRIFSTTSFYEYDFAIEYKGVLHFCGKGDRTDLARFE